MPSRRAGRSRPQRATLPTAVREAFRVVRSNLLVALADLETPIVIVTSAEPGEGKSVATAHLAVSMAQAGMRTVMVDVDIRSPSAHTLVGGHNEFGLTDVLLQRRSLEDALQYVEVDTARRAVRRGLYFLAAGSRVDNPTELLGSSRPMQVLDSLARQADIVLLDTPPVLPVADTLVIGRMAAGALLVVAARRTSSDAVLRTKDLLTRNQTRLLGIVLNQVEEEDLFIGYGYGYDYSEPDEDELRSTVGP